MPTLDEKRDLVMLKWHMMIRGDGKCYFPCCECKGFNGRRLPLKIVEKHCRDNGHVEGGNEYHPMVSN
jgi:hypothetical protein